MKTKLPVVDGEAVPAGLGRDGDVRVESVAAAPSPAAATDVGDLRLLRAIAGCILLGILAAAAGVVAGGSWWWLFAVLAGSLLAGLLVAAVIAVEVRRAARQRERGRS